MTTGQDIEQAAPSEPTGPSVGQVVVVASPKGGVGRTTVAANVAGALHAAEQRVCLVDLDLEFGDVALSLELTPVRNLLDAVEAALPDDLDDPLDMLKTEFRPGFDCILAPIDPTAADALPAGFVSDLLPALAESYDFVVVDTSAHQSTHVTAAFAAADRLLLVASPDVLNAKALHLLVGLLAASGTHARRDLVVNRAPGSKGASRGVSPADLAEAVGLPLALSLPDSVDVPRALLNGTPLVLDDSTHAFSVAISAFVQSWVRTPAAISQPGGRKKRRVLKKGKKL
jgi:pilus assembly protein CpaE